MRFKTFLEMADKDREEAIKQHQINYEKRWNQRHRNRARSDQRKKDRGLQAAIERMKQ